MASTITTTPGALPEQNPRRPARRLAHYAPYLVLVPASLLALMPFIWMSLIALFLTTYIPQLSLWLPRLLYSKGFS